MVNTALQIKVVVQELKSFIRSIREDFSLSWKDVYPEEKHKKKIYILVTCLTDPA